GYIYPLYLSPLRKIPGPPVDNFILGHYATFLKKGLGESLAHLAKQYGGIVRYHALFNKPYLLISDPKLVQKVLINHSYDYAKLFLNTTVAKDMFGEGILLANGDSHKRQRKMMNPSFAFANIKEMAPTFVQAGYKLKDIWIKQIGNKKEKRITITALIPKITLDVIVVEQKNSLIQGKDLLSLLVKANEKLPVDEQLTHDELLSQVMTLLIAGHETTSTALSWALYYLAKYPDVQNHLRKELLDVFIDRNHFPTFDEIEQLKYLDCVFKETLRIAPPFYAIHHDPLIWGGDAKHFNPSRWLDPEIKAKISNNTFFPFGAGPASCLGMKMAQLELKFILSIIIRNFEFKLVEGFTFQKKTLVVTRPEPGIDLWVSKVDY
ncbi:10341_t:CDS:2, partial [Racocetra fulgida]